MQSRSFADLGVSRPVVAALAERGITEPFAIQQLVVRDVLDGRDVLAKSPTGSGKTLAFAIPMIERIEPGRGPAALVLAPTRELAAQIVEQSQPLARVKRLEVAAVYGGVGFEKQIRACKRADILVATPGRLEDLMAPPRRPLRQPPVPRPRRGRPDARHGLPPGRRPDRLAPARGSARRCSSRPRSTARPAASRPSTRTTPPATSTSPEPVDVAQIEHRFVPTVHEDKLASLVAELGGDRGLTLVFVRTKRGADRLVKRLGREGVEAAAMHGDKSQAQREKALARFQAGKIDTLVATDVAARGIHVTGISHVINFDPPEDREGYVHRVGRTGRAGRTGVGITFVNADQAGDVAKIATALDLHEEYEQRRLLPSGPSAKGERGARPHASGAAAPSAAAGAAGRARSGATTAA